MTALQIVLDTNVIVAGLRSRRGESFRLLQQVGGDGFEINVSVPLILEYEAILARHLLHLDMERGDIDDLIDYFCAVGNHHKIFYLWRPTLRDTKDEMLLELAVKAMCSHIITFNIRDFTGIEQFGIVAMRPSDFLREIGAIA